MKHRIVRLLGWFLIVLVAVLLVVRFVGSPVVTHIANRKLAALDDYVGHVGGIHLALWRFTVTATDFTLASRHAPAAEPLVHIKQASLAVAFGSLMKGKLGGHGTVDGMDLAVVKKQTDDLKRDAKEKAPEARAWIAVIRETFPLEITRFEMENMRISFSDQSTPSAGKLVVDQLKLVATEVTNRSDGGELPTHVAIQGRVGGTGSLALDLRADPSAELPRFEARMEIKNLTLVPIRDFLISYALIDPSGGTFELFSEISATGGHYDGYVKPFFKDLKFKAVPDPQKNLLQRAATRIAAAVTDALKNDQGAVATKVPFKGDFAVNEVDLWTTVQNLLRNAFIQSLREGLEGRTPAP